jgi:hypothetical protein
MEAIFAALSGLIILAGAPPYLIDILKGKTKPQRTTWFIWSVLGIIAFIAQVQLHGGWSLVYLGLDALGNLALFLLSLKYGVGGWTWVDKAALVIAAIGIVASFAVHQPVVAIFGVVLADMSGAFLTILKTLRAPGTETTITWIFLGSAALFSALAVGKWNAQLLLYPLYLVVADGAVLGAQLIGFRRQKARAISA